MYLCCTINNFFAESRIKLFPDLRRLCLTPTFTLTTRHTPTLLPRAVWTTPDPTWETQEPSSDSGAAGYLLFRLASSAGVQVPSTTWAWATTRTETPCLPPAEVPFLRASIASWTWFWKSCESSPTRFATTRTPRP